MGLSCHGFSVGFVSGVFLVGVVRLGVSRFVIFADLVPVSVFGFGPVVFLQLV
ncbi:hypothetical protein [Halorientalis persicus]|uniref:hypothetical protein n=1 Tax=Halorientalis persicus TaxID=1367881 RepID=UPI00147C233D|nr:hypothetical protein [Halorientalis persicus]